MISYSLVYNYVNRKDENRGCKLKVCRVHNSKDGCNGGDKLSIPSLYYLIMLIFSLDTFMR